ncbi:hypothetical protein ACWDUD_11850 [Rhodococcus sp. NPDC003382]
MLAAARRGGRLMAILGVVSTVAACKYGSHLHPQPSEGGIQANFSTNQSESGPWGEYATQQSAGRFDFTIDALALQPGEPVYAPIALRTLPAVTAPVSVSLRPPLTTPNSVADVLRYSVSDAPAASCNAAGFGVATVVDDLPLATGSGTFTMQPNTIRTLCFRVEIPDGTAPLDFVGLADTVAAWEFRVRGDDPPRPPKPGFDRCGDHHHSAWFVRSGLHYVYCWSYWWRWW